MKERRALTPLRSAFLTKTGELLLKSRSLLTKTTVLHDESKARKYEKNARKPFSRAWLELGNSFPKKAIALLSMRSSWKP